MIAVTGAPRAGCPGQAENRLSGHGTVRIGDCEIGIWLVENRLDLGDGDGSWMLLSHAPALVVGLVIMSAEGKSVQGVGFDRIEVVAG